MKKVSVILLILVFVLSMCLLCACGGRNFEEELPGEWYVYHWFYHNTPNGEDGFYPDDECHFYIFDKEGNVTVKKGAKIDTAETISTGKYNFTQKDTIAVQFSDNSTKTFQLIPSGSHKEQIHLVDLANHYAETLQPMSTWSK